MVNLFGIMPNVVCVQKCACAPGLRELAGILRDVHALGRIASYAILLPDAPKTNKNEDAAQVFCCCMYYLLWLPLNKTSSRYNNEQQQQQQEKIISHYQFLLSENVMKTLRNTSVFLLFLCVVLVRFCKLISPKGFKGLGCESIHFLFNYH